MSPILHHRLICISALLLILMLILLAGIRLKQSCERVYIVTCPHCHTAFLVGWRLPVGSHYLVWHFRNHALDVSWDTVSIMLHPATE